MTGRSSAPLVQNLRILRQVTPRMIRERLYLLNPLVMKVRAVLYRAPMIKRLGTRLQAPIATVYLAKCEST